MFKIVFLLFFLFFSNYVYSQENLLTLSQQVERLQRELNDLSIAVYTGNKDPLKNNSNQKISSENDLTAIDYRIYELEKDIKKINELYEELTFQVDDLKNIIDEINLNISAMEINNSFEINNDENFETNTLSEENINEKNTLGKLVIKSEDLSVEQSNNEEEVTEIKNSENGKEIISENNNIVLDPELEFKNAFELLKNQQFSEAKTALNLFIVNHPEDELIGSAHYWLGEIYLLKKEYREAALILAEGFQKYSSSLKSPDMLYKLSEALFKIGKKDDSCSALRKFKTEFPNHKLLKKAEKKLISLDCEDLT